MSAPSVERKALDLLIQASRADPKLRAAVLEVEKWIARLIESASSAWQTVDETEEDAGRDLYYQADLRYKAEAQRDDYKLALRTIMDVPSQETLMLNAEARAMYELASRAVEGDRRHVG